MATILNEKITESFFDSVLPRYGELRANIPVWDNGQKMFICDEYESQAGHRYYSGVRFCDRVVVRERVGLYHNFTYLDGIELYAFNGTNLQLVQKRQYDKVYRSDALVRSESESMMRDYLAGASSLSGSSATPQQLEAEAQNLIAGCYTCPTHNERLRGILPQLCE